MESSNLIHESEHAIFSFLPYGTGIQDNHIRFYWIDHFPHSRRKKDHIDLFRISIIHLTAKGFDVEGFWHKKFFTSNTWRVYREKNFCKLIMSIKCVYEIQQAYENQDCKNRRARYNVPNKFSDKYQYRLLEKILSE